MTDMIIDMDRNIIEDSVDLSRMLFSVLAMNYEMLLWRIASIIVFRCL